MDPSTVIDIDWPSLLPEQMEWHWSAQARPRLDGLTDDEYRWEPVAGCWSVRPRAEATTVHAAGAGDTVIDWEWPVPEPPPVTSIAWRIGHVAVGWAHRAALHFGGPPVDYDTVDWPLDATGALRLLDESHARWAEGVAALGDAGAAVARAVTSRDPLPPTRWRRWCCTSIGRRSTTWPRWRSCATSGRHSTTRVADRAGGGASPDRGRARCRRDRAVTRCTDLAAMGRRNGGDGTWREGPNDSATSHCDGWSLAVSLSVAVVAGLAACDPAPGEGRIRLQGGFVGTASGPDAQCHGPGLLRRRVRHAGSGRATSAVQSVRVMRGRSSATTSPSSRSRASSRGTARPRALRAGPSRWTTAWLDSMPCSRPSRRPRRSADRGHASC